MFKHGEVTDTSVRYELRAKEAMERSSHLQGHIPRPWFPAQLVKSRLRSKTVRQNLELR